MRDLTIDIGRGNPGAIALDFFANNQGAMHNVRLMTSDPEHQGAIGLRLDGHAGPLLVSHLEVIGFDTGIFSNPDESATFEYVSLRDQRKVGFEVLERTFIRKLTSHNRVTALRSRGSLTVLLDAELHGRDASVPAMQMDGQAFVRDVSVLGYPVSLASPHLTLTDSQVVEWTSKDPVALDAPVRLSMRLPVEETPEVPWGELSGWANIARFTPGKITIERDGKSQEVTDWTLALQAAIDSGAHAIYFPAGKHEMYGKIWVRGNVHRIIGLERVLEPGPFRGLNLPYDQKYRPHLVIEDGGPAVVVIERFDAAYGHIFIENRSPRTLVVRNMAVDRIDSLHPQATLFTDDVLPNYTTVRGGKYFARQLNVETGLAKGTPPPDRFGVEIHDGGTAWIFGMKTEQARGKVKVASGSQAEVFAYIYSHTSNNLYPMFQVENADMTVTVMEKLLRNAPHVAVLRRITPQGPVIPRFPC